MHPKRDWNAYNRALAAEAERFPALLAELVHCIQDLSPAGRGRPPLPVREQVAVLVCKVYGGLGARGTAGVLQRLWAAGHLSAVPQHTALSRYMNNPALRPLLEELIEISAGPLRAVEVDFAVDSTGLGNRQYQHWHREKWGRGQRPARGWVKLHLMCGVQTHIAVAARVSERDAHDTLFFKPLLAVAARRFPLQTVMADRAYSSKSNIACVHAHGARPYIPFKRNTRPPAAADSSPWAQAHAAFRTDPAWQAHYHQRNQAESTMHMLKSHFPTYVRSRQARAQGNEALCIVLAHNLRVLIQEQYRRGLVPRFAETLLYGPHLTRTRPRAFDA